MAKKKITLEEKLEEAIVKDVPYEVPGNWIFVKLVNLLKGMTTKKPNKDDEFFRYIDIDAIDNKNQRVAEPKIIEVGKAPSRASRELIKGDIVFSTVRPYLRNIALISKEYEDCIASTGFYVCRCNELINNKYLYYLLCSERVINYYTSLMKGDNSPSIRKDEFENLIVPLPPLKEQKRIVDKIESLFEKLNKAKELIEEARDDFEKRKSAILDKAFRGELTKEWRKYNNYKLSEWKEKLLSETGIQIIDGDRGKNYPKKDEFKAEGYCLFLNAKNVTKEGFRFDELNFISREKDEVLRKGKLERFDIVLTTRGTIGNVAYYDENIEYENVRINSGMVIYRGGNELYKPFLCRLYGSKYIVDQIDKMKTGTAQPQLPIKIMRNLKIVVPPLEEQKEIVKVLDKILEEESKIEELTKLEDQIELIKKSILAKAFRGQLGTNCEEDESAIELLKEILNK